MTWQPKTVDTVMEEILRKQEDDREISFNYSKPVNQSLGIPGVLGQGQPSGAFGITGGSTVTHPIKVIVTDVDQEGASTGTFDRIDLRGTFMIVDAVGTNQVRWIQRASNDGQKIYLKPIDGKSLTILTGGNVDISSNVVITDQEIGWLIYTADSNITADGGFILIKTAVGSGGGSVPSGGAINDHLEWDGAAWMAQQHLEFGTTPADAGRLRAENETIGLAWRTAADDGNIELKGTSGDFFDFTDSSNGPVSIQLRAQDATVADKIGTITQVNGALGHMSIGTGTQLDFVIAAVTAVDITVSGLEMGTGLDIEMSQGQIQNLTALVYEGFGGGIGKSISKFATGIHYDLESSAHTHLFRVNGVTPIDALEIGSNSTKVSTGMLTVKHPTTVATLDLVNQDTTPIDLDQVAEIRFRADDDAGGVTENTYGRILVNMDDVTSTSKDGRLTLEVMEDDTLTPYLRLNVFSSPGTIQILKETDMNQNPLAFDERGTDPTPASNQGMLYAKDVSSETHIFWNGNGMGSPVDLTLGGGSTPDKIEEGNSSVEVIDTGTGSIVFTVDSNQVGDVDFGNGWTFDNDAFFNFSVTLGETSADKILGNALVQRDWSPFDNITWNLGEATKMWAAVFARNIRFNASTAFINYVSPTMAFEVPATEFFNWEIGNVIEATLTASDFDVQGKSISGITVLNFNDGNVIGTTPAKAYVTMPAATDTFEWDYNSINKYLWSQAGLQADHDSNFSWQFFRSDSSPNDGDVIMQTDWEALNSSSSQLEYVRETIIASDVTAASEDGKWTIDVARNGSLAEVFRAEGLTAGVGLSFFGASAQSKQNITGSRGGNAALASLLTALAGYGLILDSTT